MELKDLDKLIELSLADGQISPQELAIIQQRAASLGVTNEELQLMINGKMQQMRKSPVSFMPKPSQKDKIRRCPACGAIVDYGVLRCPECGTEIPADDGTNLDSLASSLRNAKKKTQKVDLIKYSTIPSAKDELIKYLSFAASQYTAILNNEYTFSFGNRSIKASWEQKLEEAFLKACTFRLDKSDNNTLDRLHDSIDSAKRKKRTKKIFLALITFVILLAIGGAVVYVAQQQAKKENIEKQYKEKAENSTFKSVNDVLEYVEGKTYVKEGKTISFLEGELYVNGTPRGDSFEVTSYDGYTAVIDIEDANGGYISIKIDSENNTLIDRISHNVYTLKE